MKIEYKELKGLPSLAWCAIMTKGEEVMNALVGSMVECREDGFVSGIWDGEFEKQDFHTATYGCLTGCKSTEWGGVFITPTHMQEYLFAVKKDDKLYVSNSMPFVLLESGERLDADYYDYEYDLNSTMLGYERCHRSTPLRGGNKLMIFRGCRVSVDKNLNIKEERQNHRFPMGNFAEYKASVLGVLDRMVKNAQSPARKHQYSLITTISRGYDACASSVLAHEVGCDTSLSFVAPAKYLKDDGRKIAKVIGYKNILTGDADEFMLNDDFLEAEDSCSGVPGGNVSDYCFEKYTQGKVLFGGQRGDSMWERLHVNVNNNLDYTAGNTLAQTGVTIEPHLRNNTIAVDVPLIGCNQWTDMARISNSEEMKPWVVREHYDRPIARRLVEEAGVGREEFGRAKMGAGITLHYETMKTISRKMSKKSYADFIRFCNGLNRNRWKEFCNDIRYYSSEYPDYMNFVFNKLHLKLRIHKKTGWKSSPTTQLLILWATETMIKKYQIYTQQ